jgi:hypothetical protein
MIAEVAWNHDIKVRTRAWELFVSLKAGVCNVWFLCWSGWGLLLWQAVWGVAVCVGCCVLCACMLVAMWCCGEYACAVFPGGWWFQPRQLGREQVAPLQLERLVGRGSVCAVCMVCQCCGHGSNPMFHVRQVGDGCCLAWLPWLCLGVRCPECGSEEIQTHVASSFHVGVQTPCRLQLQCMKGGAVELFAGSRTGAGTSTLQQTAAKSLNGAVLSCVV